jgi:hypothetical protein
LSSQPQEFLDKTTSVFLSLAKIDILWSQGATCQFLFVAEK